MIECVVCGRRFPVPAPPGITSGELYFVCMDCTLDGYGAYLPVPVTIASMSPDLNNLNVDPFPL
ncbi:hypothetical protein KAT92_05285 [Candidatus Babeliales bacterium]|nr:hypothetical protein [Candidatus Babeliales bacterium]